MRPSFPIARIRRYREAIPDRLLVVAATAILSALLSVAIFSPAGDPGLPIAVGRGWSARAHLHPVGHWPVCGAVCRCGSGHRCVGHLHRVWAWLRHCRRGIRHWRRDGRQLISSRIVESNRYRGSADHRRFGLSGARFVRVAFHSRKRAADCGRLPRRSIQQCLLERSDRDPIGRRRGAWTRGATSSSCRAEHR